MADASDSIPERAPARSVPSATNGNEAVPSVAAGRAIERFETVLVSMDGALRSLNGHLRALAHGRRPDVIAMPAERPILKAVGAVALTLLIFGGGFAVLWMYLLQRVPIHTALPYEHAAGPVVQDGKIYIADWFRQTLYVHSVKSGFPVSSVEMLPNPFITGFAVADGDVYTIQGKRGELLLHDGTRERSVVRASALPDPRVSSVFAEDASRLWVANAGDRILYRVDKADPRIPIERYDMPQTVTAFSVRTGSAWVLDAPSRSIGVYRLQTPVQRLAAVDLDPYLKGAIPTGLFVDRHLWIVTEKPATLIRLALPDTAPRS